MCCFLHLNVFWWRTGKYLIFDHLRRINGIISSYQTKFDCYSGSFINWEQNQNQLFAGLETWRQWLILQISENTDPISDPFTMSLLPPNEPRLNPDPNGQWRGDPELKTDTVQFLSVCSKNINPVQQQFFSYFHQLLEIDTLKLKSVCGKSAFEFKPVKRVQ